MGLPPRSSFTAAVYDLERGNIIVTDPNDPTVSLLVDAQRRAAWNSASAGT